ncbi:RnfABCDGE type electron transport complex subunit D [Teredinibacter haidensis]|uniref:RnfABCDGE type electron transport complex subunit D n=1 Tax=Teredinibacter haidensis TaxID=2731755 RepID=UPI000948F81D|nr:RnfABCDGE type electron transport complex subunit D [Teredinibacter haidensis]
MSDAPIYSSPFAHEGSSVGGVMMQVCLALVPCTLFGLYLFGWPAINVFVVTCLAAVITEVLCLWVMNQPLYRLLDGSALLTGWLIAITLPPWAPWWIGAVGSFFAIAVGKQLYGGIGQNIFNPAMLARTALLITFPLQLTTWVSPLPLGSEGAPSFMEGLNFTFLGAAIPDGLTGATSLGHLKTSLILAQPASEVLRESFNVWNSLLGMNAGSLGETSEILILLGGLWLIWRRVISWEIPVSLIGGLAVLSYLSGMYNDQYFAGAAFHLSSGGVLLGAFFIATDPITSPVGRVAKLIFGAGCAAIIFIIRSWGGFPEAVAFSVLFMNAFTPLIDRYFRPRVYGRFPGGKPLRAMSSIELTREVKRK